MSEPTCEAPADLSKLGGPRCGKPATHLTPLGARCDTCTERFREAARNPHSFISVIAGRARTEEEIAKMVRPLEVN